MNLPDHLLKPDLRPIQPIPIVREGQRLFALRDPSQLSSQTMIVPPQALAVLQQFRGERSIEEIAEGLSGNLEQFVELVRSLDQIGLLWGPTFERLEGELKEKIQKQGAISSGAAASMGEDEAACRSRMDEYFEQTEDPELEGTVVGIVAPHLDYDRGWPNYAAAYYVLRDTPKPDRVVVLGTNHFGIGDGVVMTEFSFDSPMGRCPNDPDVLEGLMGRLGETLVIDQLDMLAEHSIQLQLPWIQYCFGTVPIVAALVPDPLVPMLEDAETSRIEGKAFTTQLREVLDEVGGNSLIVASSDLSHVGPQFGEPRAVDEQRRIDIERYDRDMLGKFMGGELEEFISAMTWTGNSTRWCSIGNMSAALSLTQPEMVELIDYRQAYDDNGQALVSSAAMVFMGG